MREICIAGKGFSSYSFTFKNSIIRRAPFKKLYNLLINDLSNNDKCLDYISISKYLKPIQLKICKVS